MATLHSAAMAFSPHPPRRTTTASRDFLEPVTMIDWTAAGQKPAGVAEILHYLQDALGSIVALTNPAGAAALSCATAL